MLGLQGNGDAELLYFLCSIVIVRVIDMMIL